MYDIIRSYFRDGNSHERKLVFTHDTSIVQKNLQCCKLSNFVWSDRGTINPS